jgi:hypothetical protein
MRWHSNVYFTVEQFTLAVASYVTVRLLQRFDNIENHDKDATKSHLTLVNISRTGVKVRINTSL